MTQLRFPSRWEGPPDADDAEDSAEQRRFVGIDERFTFDYQTYETLADGQRWSRWDDLEALCKGPDPRPDWVVTSSGAIDTDLGILKTGKDAECFLIERQDPHDPDTAVVMVAKRYREKQALKSRRLWVQASENSRSAMQEWERLKTCWAIGLPTPYPVQVDGSEIVMEWFCHDGDTAPRLAQTRPSRESLLDLWEQLREAMLLMTRAGWVHGDLSPFNTLVAGERLVIIDVPQMIDLYSSGYGPDTLLRDCVTMCTWFEARGLEVDGQELFGELMASAF